MILLLIPVAGLVLGVGLWAGMRGLGSLSMGVDRPVRAGRVTWRERRASGEPFSLRPGSQGVRELAANLPQWCLIAVIAVSGMWILAWLIFLIFGLNLLS